jgi:Sulfotransferase domain
MEGRLQPYAVFFISTGRCGTQWFAKNLDEYYREIAHVCHEPLREEYQARYYYIAHKSEREVQLSPVLEAHLESIAAKLADKHYVETGFPAYGLIPTLIKRFKGRIKIVHLYRHPVAVASSLLTQEIYHREDWIKPLVIVPSDLGEHRPEFDGMRWESMGDFQKCLFFWAEINSWALGLRAEFADVPWFSLKFEDVFGQNGDEHLRRLLKFLDLPVNEKFIKTRIRKVDQARSTTSDRFYLQISTECPEVALLSEQLGYQLQSFDKEQLRSRYYRNKYVARLGRRARGVLNLHTLRKYGLIKRT